MVGEKMRLNIENIVALCTPGSNEFNEDICGFKDNVVWVLDGATGLNKNNYMPDGTDARWYSCWWDKYLRENIDDDVSLDDVMKKGIRKIKKEFEENLLNYDGSKFEDLSKIELPTASIALLRLCSGYFEYFILGDCRIYTDKNGSKKLSDDSVSILDAEVFDSMKAMNDFGLINFSEIKNRVKPQIIENRLKNNTEGGYWILSFDERAIDNAFKGKIAIYDNMKVLMASDGYYALSEKYHIFPEEELLEHTISKGVVSMFNILRKFEEEEDNIRFIPRFKKMDDCTCVLFDIKVIEEEEVII